MPSKIGRFNIVKVLGQGSQGIVYLAKDPVLERQVAIKTIDKKHANKTENLNKLLMDEAKVISKMSHPNIVSIYEAGEEAGTSYLVFEYIKGQTLSELIKSKQFQSLKKAIPLFQSICLGMQHSHKNEIIHGDLKPANIILDENDVPKIMDFGIARLLTEQTSSDQLYGTPRYMSPEYLRNREVTAANDVYALGLILFELITGEVAIPGKDIKEIVNHVFNGKIKLPSAYNSKQGNKETHEVFEHIILKATEKDRRQRFNSMQEIIDAIKKYTDKALIINPAGKSEHAAISFLMRKIKRQQDFPALSETLIKVNTLVDNDSSDSAELSSVIAEDMALTNKILKLVNSGYYRGAKPEVKTISQAVLMLGFKEIRMIAMSLILIEHLHNKSKASKIKSHIVASIYSGILSKDLSFELGLKEHEESFLSGTFHQLGELLTLFYFHEEAEEIELLIEEDNLTKEQAATKILGVSYLKLGTAIAREWKLPNYIIDDLAPYKVDKNLSASDRKKLQLKDQEKRRAISSLSNQLSDALEDKNDSQWRSSAVKVWREYSDALKLKDDSLKRLAEQARNNLVEINHIFKINLNESDVISKVQSLNNPSEQDAEDLDKTQVLTAEEIDSYTKEALDDINTIANKEKIDPGIVLEKALRDIQYELK
ncbi:MAG: protein kinase, partial [Gammaproteobacteria bacterium]|nr:protein kinase [Gammaproteobacteria bacterium]